MKSFIRCLTNIASGDTEHTSKLKPLKKFDLFFVKLFFEIFRTEAVLEAVPILIQLLDEDSMGTGLDTSLQELCCWALGNIAGDDEECRTTILRNGCLLPLTRQLQHAMETMMKTATDATHSMSQESALHAPPNHPPLHTDYLGQTTSTLTVSEVHVQTVAWAISNLCRGSSASAKDFVDASYASSFYSSLLHILY